MRTTMTKMTTRCNLHQRWLGRQQQPHSLHVASLLFSATGNTKTTPRLQQQLLSYRRRCMSTEHGTPLPPFRKVIKNDDGDDEQNKETSPPNNSSNNNTVNTDSTNESSSSSASLPSSSVSPSPGLPTTNSRHQQRLQSLPTKHSSKRLPTVVTDLTQLSDMAAEIANAEIGHLFAYTHNYPNNNKNWKPATGSSPTKEEASDAMAAWEAADATVQRVEAVVRGCAHFVPGTLWNRWVPPSVTPPQQQHSDSTAFDLLLQIQQQMVDRIYDEGYAYMTMRSHHLLSRVQQPSVKSELHRDVGEDDNALLDEGEGHTSSTPDNNSVKEDSSMYDFALPGPTVAMYDTILDTIACCCATLQQQGTDGGGPREEEEEKALQLLNAANHFHNVAMVRHSMDGGDASNVNLHTRPTAVTFNALIRVAANLPYATIPTAKSPSTTTHHHAVQLRDEAITTAVSTLQAMQECGIVHRNSATYTYALECMAKYLPPSRIKGNICSGMFHQARYVGLINESVIQAYTNANRPSNDALDDAFIRDTLEAGNWPVKWKRESRKRQHHPREHVY